uniref:MIF4G domain-containing protein n=1 Tax=Lactuca sativa TaxID=4236 RepID=A0A9R1UMZ5_LACSA|nr:hypothetical protein LSAT_V11C800396530 [Lactuca sativa]
MMERQRDRDEDDKYKRRRDDDRYRSERDSQDRRRLNNKSDGEDADGRRGRDRNKEIVNDRNMNSSDDEDANDMRRRDRRRGDDYANDRRRRRRRDGWSDNEYKSDKRRDKKKDKGRDEEDDNDRRRRRRDDDEDGNNRRNKEKNEDMRKRGRSKDIRSDDEDGNDKNNRNKNVDKKRSDEHDQSDEEVGEIRKKNEDRSDEEYGEIRKSGRNGKYDDSSDKEGGEIRKRGRKGKDRRSDDEDDRKDRRRERKNDRSDNDDDKYKRRRNRNKDEKNDDEDDRRQDYKRDRKRNGDHKERRRTDNDVLKHKVDQNGDKEKPDEGARFKKLADLQESMTNLGKSGGVYIPPFKLARMMSEFQDKSSMEYQRMTWDALRKSINGLVNKVNDTNIKNIIPELFAENLIRGRGLFCRSCMKSQMASPRFTDVFSALPQLLAVVKFIAHLVNQHVVHELIALELLTTLLENTTDDSVDVVVGFVTECGSILQDLSPRGLHGIFERFRRILHEGEIDKRVQFLIKGLFALRKAKFQGHPAVSPELDLVKLEDQLTHEVSLLDKIDPELP